MGGGETDCFIAIGSIKREMNPMQIEIVRPEQKNFSICIFSSVRYIHRNLQPTHLLQPSPNGVSHQP